MVSISVNMNEDWEQVTPFLQEMQHCTDEDYFNPQEVSALRSWLIFKSKIPPETAETE